MHNSTNQLIGGPGGPSGPCGPCIESQSEAELTWHKYVSLALVKEKGLPTNWPLDAQVLLVPLGRLVRVGHLDLLALWEMEKQELNMIV